MPIRLLSFLIIFLALFIVACGGGNSKQTWHPPEPTRAFHMAMTPFPPDFNDDPGLLTQIVNEVYNKLSTNTDMVAHHFDNGIPWNDALTNTFPYNNHIMSDWQFRRDGGRDARRDRAREPGRVLPVRPPSGRSAGRCPASRVPRWD